MCRKGGRRCPSTKKHEADPAWRDARNARRRAAYAEKVAAQKAAAQTAAAAAYDLDDPDLRDKVDEFLNEHCAVFADEMNKKTGWPLVAVVDDITEDEDGNPTQYGWLHVGVLSPDGKFVDALGARDIEEVLDEYEPLAEPSSAYGGEVDLIQLDRKEADGKLGMYYALENIPDDLRSRADALSTQWNGRLNSATSPEPSEDDYRMQHTAPDREYGAAAHDMTGSGIYPDDFYTHPQYYTSGNDQADTETLTVLKQVKGNPDALVTVYRAAPTGKGMNPGDWVTLSPTYAAEHAMMDDNPENDMPVHAFKVRARDLYSAGDLNEFGWDPGDDIDRGQVVSLGSSWPAEEPHPVTGWRMPKNQVQLPDGRHVRLEESGDGVGTVGYNGRFRMFDEQSGAYMGHIDYQSSGNDEDKALIAMIEVEPEYRGSGVADALVARVAYEFPQGLKGGMLTDDGAKWWPKIARRMGWE